MIEQQAATADAAQIESARREPGVQGKCHAASMAAGSWISTRNVTVYFDTSILLKAKNGIGGAAFSTHDSAD